MSTTITTHAHTAQDGVTEIPTSVDTQFFTRRVPKGRSDAVSVTCDCSNTAPGAVLLFYRYIPVEDPLALAAHQRDLGTHLRLTGKCRIAAEGFNITLAGTKASIQTYMKTMAHHPLLRDLELWDAAKGDWFFKP